MRIACFIDKIGHDRRVQAEFGPAAGQPDLRPAADGETDDQDGAIGLSVQEDAAQIGDCRAHLDPALVFYSGREVWLSDHGQAAGIYIVIPHLFLVSLDD